jgi:hypothetical protein
MIAPTPRRSDAFMAFARRHVYAFKENKQKSETVGPFTEILRLSLPIDYERGKAQLGGRRTSNS